jgi:hypothetical protein
MDISVPVALQVVFSAQVVRFFGSFFAAPSGLARSLSIPNEAFGRSFFP